MHLLLILVLLSSAPAAGGQSSDRGMAAVADTVVVPAVIMEEDLPENGLLPRPVTGRIAPIQYPASARRDGLRGTVRVRFTVTEAGEARDIEVVRGVRHDLDRAAVDAVRRTDFQPGQIAGEPVRVRMTAPIRFRLGR